MTSNAKDLLHHWREAVPNDRLAHLIRDAARAFSRTLQMRLGNRSVPIGHWTFLRILWAKDGLTQKELSDKAGVMESTTAVALKAMEALGYIERRRHPRNQKNLHVYLTAKGRSLEKRLVPLAIEANEIGVRGISAEHLAITRSSLLRIIENLAAEESDSALEKPLRRKTWSAN
jgi:DNA-binding MarR family transcriptional regulator